MDRKLIGIAAARKRGPEGLATNALSCRAAASGALERCTQTESEDRTLDLEGGYHFVKADGVGNRACASQAGLVTNSCHSVG